MNFVADGDGATLAELSINGLGVSRLWIVPFVLRVGAASVRMDGIAGVGTKEEHQKKGYARQVIDATLDHMRHRDAALSMLYGIPDFYPKFGFATAGPDHFISVETLPSYTPPEGWQVRDVQPSDLSSVRALYDDATRESVGCACHGEGARRWRSLLEAPRSDEGDGCRVVVEPGGRVLGYIWRGAEHWYSDQVERTGKTVLSVGEAMAATAQAADVVLGVCQAWGTEEALRRGREVTRVLISQPPTGRVAFAAMRQDSEFIQHYDRCGNSMVRIIDLYRLLHSLRPELERRLEQSGCRFTGILTIETDIGSGALQVDAGRLRAIDGDPMAATGKKLRLRMPQYELARLALGALPPADILERLESPPDEETSALVATLFPARHPHLYLMDRF